MKEIKRLSATEEQDLLDCIAGLGKWEFAGPWLRTHPLSEWGQELHEICLDLESRGAIRRVSESPRVVTWEVVKK